MFMINKMIVINHPIVNCFVGNASSILFTDTFEIISSEDL